MVMVRFGRFEVDLTHRLLRSNRVPVALRRKAFDVLAVIVEKPNCVVTKSEIIDRVWPNSDASDESLARCVSDIRSALGDGGREFLRTVPGVGYVLASNATAPEPQLKEVIGRPTVAVLPFSIPGTERKGSDYADYLTEEISIELCRFSDLAVIASNSCFHFRDPALDLRDIGRQLGADFVVEGSVRRVDERLRVTAKLTETIGAARLWADAFDNSTDDISRVQSQIAGTIAGITGAHISRAASDRVWAPLGVKGQAYEVYVEALRLMRAWYATYRDIDNLYRARRLFERVINVAPSEARAYSGLASTYFSTFLFRHDGDFRNAAILSRIKDLCRVAIELDPHLPDTFGHLGHVFLHEGDHDSALASHRRSYAINPNRCDFRYAAALVMSGEHDEAIAISLKGMRLDPFHSPVARGWYGAAHFFKSDYAAALPALLEATSRAAGWRGGLLYLTATYERLGEIDKARRVAKRIIEIEPDWTIDATGRAINKFKRGGDAELFFGSLARAGLR